jgi:hypothetical protein
VTLEVVNAIASIGTLLVISATAVAALGQLRHMRGSNQIQALTECREVLESAEFQRALLFISKELPAAMRDPEVRASLMTPPVPENLRAINVVGNFFESMGGFVKHDIIDADIARDLWSGIIAQTWRRLRPTLAVMRRTSGRGLWENFEYLASLSEEWNARYPDGLYPAGRARLEIEDEWRAEDERLGLYKTR